MEPILADDYVAEQLRVSRGSPLFLRRAGHSCGVSTTEVARVPTRYTECDGASSSMAPIGRMR